MIGIDTASISRIKKAISSDGFLKRVFTEGEIEYCSSKGCPEQSFAGIFCAKEAAVKAIKRGFSGGIMPKDIEITHENGAPVLRFHGEAAKLFDGFDCDASISHDGDCAVAVVMLTKREA